MLDLPLFGGLAPFELKTPAPIIPAKVIDKQLNPVDPAVLVALRRANVSRKANQTTISLAPLDANVYSTIKELLANYGFVWKASLKTHIGSNLDWNLLQEVLETGLFFDSKRELEFFATSDDGARQLVRLFASDVWATNPRILEPSAGDGALVAATLEEIPTARITAIELDFIRARKLRMRFADDERVRVIHGSILDLQENGYDGAIMNPPFSCALEHVKTVYALCRFGAPIYGIAMLTRKQDRELAEWLNQNDAESDLTDPDTFRDTIVRASYFWLRVHNSLYEELVSALRPYQRITESDIRRLSIISRDFHKLFEDECNGLIATEEIYNQKITALENEALSIVGHHGIRVQLAYDPRAGHGIRLILPSGQTNDFGQSGMIVPNALLDYNASREATRNLYDIKTAASRPPVRKRRAAA